MRMFQSSTDYWSLLTCKIQDTHVNRLYKDHQDHQSHEPHRLMRFPNQPIDGRSARIRWEMIGVHNTLRDMTDVFFLFGFSFFWGFSLKIIYIYMSSEVLIQKKYPGKDTQGTFKIDPSPVQCFYRRLSHPKIHEMFGYHFSHLSRLT